MKKLRGAISEVFAGWHMRWVMKNRPRVTRELEYEITMQLYVAGITFSKINAWRRWRRLPPVVAYTTKNKKVIRWYTYQVTPEQRQECFKRGEHLVLVSQ